MSWKRAILLISCALTIATEGYCQEQSYRSVLLKDLSAKAVSFKEQFGSDVITEYDENGIVTNIGLDIFDLETAELFPENICGFLSRYFLELLCWDQTSIQRKIADDDVVFLTGIPEDAVKLRADMAFSLDRIGNSRYVATWKEDDTTVLSISFPIQFELILGMPQAEIEQKLNEDILIQASSFIPEAEAPETTLLPNGLHQSAPSHHFYAQEMTDCRFYKEKEDGSMEPVFDGSMPMESAANLFHGLISTECQLDIKQRVYGYENKEYSVSLAQWLKYCESQSLRTYLSIEKEDDESILALVICENSDLAYNHMLSVAIPRAFFTDGAKELKTKLYAYIPTHNIKDLYNTDRD